MKIIQFLIGPQTQTYQGRILGLGDDGKIYMEVAVYDKDDNLIDHKRQWAEIEILPPKSA